MSEASDTVVDTIFDRRSPYAFSSDELSPEELNALFEAAQWAPSSFNEQPWRFFVGQKGDDVYDTILGTLMDANAGWAKKAPILIIAATSTRFSHNDKVNAHARYDLGQAVASMALAGWAKGIGMHQMAGFSAEAAAKAFSLPENIEAVTAIAIGKIADPASLDDEARKKEAGPRNRRPLKESVFEGDLTSPARFID